MNLVLSSWKGLLLAVLGSVLLSACSQESGDVSHDKAHEMHSHHAGGMAKAPGIELVEAAARATKPGMTSSAAYMTIRNTGSDVLTLTGVVSPVAKKSELHTTIMKDGVMKMQHVEDFQIEPGEEVVLKPGGYHAMLMGLNEEVKEGDKVPVTLTFNNDKEVTVEAVAMEIIKGQGMAH